jgi:hypothetical protein
MIKRLAEMIKEAGASLVAEGIEDTELLRLIIDTGFETLARATCFIHYRGLIAANHLADERLC